MLEKVRVEGADGAQTVVVPVVVFQSEQLEPLQALT
jgi:hypothetical protein